jgi:hypothetical protein
MDGARSLEVKWAWHEARAGFILDEAPSYLSYVPYHMEPFISPDILCL